MADQEIKFKIGETTYDTATVDEISLRDIVLFNSQAAEIGWDVKWADVERIAAETASRPAKDGPHPEALAMFAVTIWAARRIAGEDVTVGEAIDVKMSDIEIVEGPKAPKDHEPKKRQPRKSTPASSLAAVPPADESAPAETTPQTSSA